MIRIGVIGYGYWGPNLVRNFAESRAQLACVADLRNERLQLVAKRFPGVNTATDFNELLADPTIDAVAIATPVFTHYELALRALTAGKHVLVEKPLASSSEQVLRLMDEAARRQLVLMVDHTFVYTGAVRKIRELIDSKTLGEIYYYDSARVNLGLFQHDVNVLWDLAVHDLSIMDFLLGAPPCAVSATGAKHIPSGTEDIAYLTVFFDNALIAHIHANWLAPVKLRRTLIGASEKMVVYDDLEQVEKIKIYDKGITLSNHINDEKMHQLLVGYRTGDMWAPNLSGAEALRVEVEHFVDCIERKQTPITGGAAGLHVVQLLEAATLSMQERGRPVELPRSSQTGV